MKRRYIVRASNLSGRWHVIDSQRKPKPRIMALCLSRDEARHIARLLNQEVATP